MDGPHRPDGIYVIRTPLPDTELDSPAVVEAYKALSHVERDFRTIKIDDLDLRDLRSVVNAAARLRWLSMAADSSAGSTGLVTWVW